MPPTKGMAGGRAAARDGGDNGSAMVEVVPLLAAVVL